jgi:hypothetical protein
MLSADEKSAGLARTDDQDSPRLERRSDGRLWVLGRGKPRPVTVSRCFPWSEPTRYVSLRDEDDEVALVREVGELDAASRKALESALLEAGFTLEIEELFEIEEEIEIRSWRVRTRTGERSFQTPRDEWPREVPGGGLIIRDVSGDLFYIPEPERLNKASQRLLWPFVD